MACSQNIDTDIIIKGVHTPYVHVTYFQKSSEMFYRILQQLPVIFLEDQQYQHTIQHTGIYMYAQC